MKVCEQIVKEQAPFTHLAQSVWEIEEEKHHKIIAQQAGVNFSCAFFLS